MIYKRSFIERKREEGEKSVQIRRGFGRFLQLTKNISPSRPVDT